MKKLLQCAWIATALSVPVAGNADWSITRFDINGNNVESVAINDSGQVLISDGSGSAFITGADGVGITKLGSSMSPVDINDSGQVAGWFNFIPGEYTPHAFITGPNGVGRTDLGNFGASSSGSLDIGGINNSGQVTVNFRSCFLCSTQAFITGPNGVGSTELISPDRFTPFIGIGSINDSGQTEGFYQTGGGIRAFITSPDYTDFTDLNTLNGASEVSSSDINNFGQVAGNALSVNDNITAIITGPNGVGMTDLGTLGGYFSDTFAINESGEVVGESTMSGDEFDYHAFLFSHGGITDLSLLDVVVAGGWTGLRAFDINNNGQIVGTGNLGAFLLSYTPDTIFDTKPIFIPDHRPPPPIPEPSIIAMLVIGLGLIGFIGYLRKQNINPDNIKNPHAELSLGY